MSPAAVKCGLVLLPHRVTNRLGACALSVVARETEEPSGANGHYFRQASEGGRPRPRSWTLYRYTRKYIYVYITHTLTVSHFTPCDTPEDLVINSACLTSDLKVPFDAKISSRFLL